MTKLLSRHSWRLVSVFAALTVPLASLPAQQAPAPTKPEKQDEVIVLSPFTVTADNNGYLATNALSGTRLNTRLEDLASAGAATGAARRVRPVGCQSLSAGWRLLPDLCPAASSCRY